MNTDNDSTDVGWYLDDIRVYTCGRGAAEHPASPATRRRSRLTATRTLVAVRRDRRSVVGRRHRIAGRPARLRVGADLGKRISVRVTARSRPARATFSPATARCSGDSGGSSAAGRTAAVADRGEPARDPAGSAGDGARRAAETGCRRRARRRGRPGRARPGRHAAGPPRPPLRLRRAGVDGRHRGAGCPGQGAVRRQGPRRLRRPAQRRTPTTPAPSRRCGGWSAPSRCSARRSPSSPGCSPSATPAPAPTCSGSPYRPGTRPPRSSRRRPRSRSSVDTAAAAARVGGLPGGRRVPGPSGRRRRPARGLVGAAGGGLATAARRRRRRPRWRAAAAACSASPTSATSPGSTPPSPPCSGPGTTSCSPPGAGRPAATASSSPSPAARAGSWSAPARRRSPPCTTSGWWRSGTTATTSTPSRARRTPTPARCC